MLVSLLILFALSFSTGIWLGFAGAPYAPVLLLAHKLASVAAALVALYWLVRLFSVAGMSGFAVALLLTFALVLASLFLSGVMLSASGLHSARWQGLHIGATAVLVLGGLLAFFLP